MKNHASKLLIFIAIIFTGLPVLAQKGYEIKVKIPAYKDSTIILAHYFARENTFYPDDTAKISKKGTGVFKGVKPLLGGMYIVLLPSKRYFDLILGDNQIFSVDVDTSDLIKGITFQGSVENKLFYEYRNLLTSKGKMVSALNEQKNKAISASQKDSITNILKEIDQEVTSYSSKIIADNPTLYISTWLKSFREVEVPDFPRDTSGNVVDSMFQIRYWHNHFFDNFNIADVRLLHTPFYEKKVKYFIEKVIPMQTDSINKDIDIMMQKTKGNNEVFRYFLGLLYNHYATLANQYVGMDAVFIYFAEKYYLPNATWSDDKFKENLKKEIAKIKPNLIGNVAPNIPLIEVPTDHFRVAAIDTAVKSDIHMGNLMSFQNSKEKYLVLAFWEVDCGHCKKAMPLLYDSIYPRLKDMKVQIIAIHMITSIEGKRKWVDFVNAHAMYDWINAVPYGYEYKDLYNVYTLPSIYILDENRKIVAKRIGIEQIEEVIEMDLKRKADIVSN